MHFNQLWIFKSGDMHTPVDMHVCIYMCARVCVQLHPQVIHAYLSVSLRMHRLMSKIFKPCK